MIKASPNSYDWYENHIRTYRETDGREGHYVDFTEMGGGAKVPTLLLKTIGRKSGKVFILPLIYGQYDNSYVIVASSGGSPKHPAWFLNMEAAEEVAFQVAEQHFIGGWRVIEGEERDAVWDQMVGVYPPYAEYQARTTRHIPVIVLTPTRETETL